MIMENIFDVFNGIYKRYDFAVYSTENPHHPNGTTFCYNFEDVLTAVKRCINIWHYSLESVKIIRKKDNKEISVDTIFEMEKKIQDIKESIFN